MKSMLDSVLLPSDYYRSMSVTKHTFFRCVSINGLFLIGYPFLLEHYRSLFADPPLTSIVINVLISILLILVVGALDTYMFCRPITDLFKFISAKTEGFQDPLLFTKAAKIYTLSALIVNPVLILVTEVIFNDLNINSGDFTIVLYMFTLVLLQIWPLGIMTRGLSSVLRHKRQQRGLVFIAIGIWAIIWAVVIRSVFLELLLKLYVLVPGVNLMN